MRLYTEEELKKAVEYACGMQKAEDYQIVGTCLIGAPDIEKAIENTLNYLYDTDNNDSKNITIEEINEHLAEFK